MKYSVKILFILSFAGGSEVLATETAIKAILSSHEDAKSPVILSKLEITNIMERPPKEAVSGLIAEAESRSGSEYAKCLVFSAALIEMLHVPKIEHQAMDAAADWVNNERGGELEDKLLKAFSPTYRSGDGKAAILKSLFTEFKESEGDPTFEIYGSALVFGLSGISILDLLELKTIGALVASGDLESADLMLEDAVKKQWSGECAKYLASIRLLRNLQQNDTPLFGRD